VQLLQRERGRQHQSDAGSGRIQLQEADEAASCDYLLFFFQVIKAVENHSMSLAIASWGQIPCFSGSTS
jgi:hypothetical protein